jgi:GH24 family phage-related lysozyme (muramidase)
MDFGAIRIPIIGDLSKLSDQLKSISDAPIQLKFDLQGLKQQIEQVIKASQPTIELNTPQLTKALTAVDVKPLATKLGSAVEVSVEDAVKRAIASPITANAVVTVAAEPIARAVTGATASLTQATQQATAALKDAATATGKVTAVFTQKTAVEASAQARADARADARLSAQISSDGRFDARADARADALLAASDRATRTATTQALYASAEDARAAARADARAAAQNDVQRQVVSRTSELYNRQAVSTAAQTQVAATLVAATINQTQTEAASTRVLGAAVTGNTTAIEALGINTTATVTAIGQATTRISDASTTTNQTLTESVDTITQSVDGAVRKIDLASTRITTPQPAVINATATATAAAVSATVTPPIEQLKSETVSSINSLAGTFISVGGSIVSAVRSTSVGFVESVLRQAIGTAVTDRVTAPGAFNRLQTEIKDLTRLASASLRTPSAGGGFNATGKAKIGGESVEGNRNLLSALGDVAQKTDTSIRSLLGFLNKTGGTDALAKLSGAIGAISEGRVIKTAEAFGDLTTAIGKIKVTEEVVAPITDSFGKLGGAVGGVGSEVGKLGMGAAQALHLDTAAKAAVGALGSVGEASADALAKVADTAVEVGRKTADGLSGIGGAVAESFTRSDMLGALNKMFTSIKNLTEELTKANAVSATVLVESGAARQGLEALNRAGLGSGTPVPRPAVQQTTTQYGRVVYTPAPPQPTGFEELKITSQTIDILEKQVSKLETASKEAGSAIVGVGVAVGKVFYLDNLIKPVTDGLDVIVNTSASAAGAIGGGFVEGFGMATRAINATISTVKALQDSLAQITVSVDTAKGEVALTAGLVPNPQQPQRPGQPVTTTYQQPQRPGQPPVTTTYQQPQRPGVPYGSLYGQQRPGQPQGQPNTQATQRITQDTKAIDDQTRAIDRNTQALIQQEEVKKKVVASPIRVDLPQEERKTVEASSNFGSVAAQTSLSKLEVSPEIFAQIKLVQAQLNDLQTMSLRQLKTIAAELNIQPANEYAGKGEIRKVIQEYVTGVESAEQAAYKVSSAWKRASNEFLEEMGVLKRAADETGEYLVDELNHGAADVVAMAWERTKKAFVAVTNVLTATAKKTGQSISDAVAPTSGTTNALYKKLEAFAGRFESLFKGVSKQAKKTAVEVNQDLGTVGDVAPQPTMLQHLKGLLGEIKTAGREAAQELGTQAGLFNKLVGNFNFNKLDGLAGGFPDITSTMTKGVGLFGTGLVAVTANLSRFSEAAIETFKNVSQAIAGFSLEAVKTAGQISQSLNTVISITGQKDDSALKSAIVEAGIASSQTTAAIAKYSVVLAQSGVSQKDISGSIKAVAIAADASNENISKVGTSLLTAANAYQISKTKLGETASTVLAATTSAQNASISGFNSFTQYFKVQGETQSSALKTSTELYALLKSAGAQDAAAGRNIATLFKALAAPSNKQAGAQQGINEALAAQGSENRLSAYDATGKFKNQREVVLQAAAAYRELKKSIGDQAATELFAGSIGVEAFRQVQALSLQTEKQIDTTLENIRRKSSDPTFQAQLYQQALSGIGGAQKALDGSIDGFTAKYGLALEGIATPITAGLGVALGKVATDPQVFAGIEAIGAQVTAAANTEGFTKLIDGFAKLASGAIQQGVSGLGDIFRDLKNQLGGIDDILKVVGVGLQVFVNYMLLMAGGFKNLIALGYDFTTLIADIFSGKTVGNNKGNPFLKGMDVDTKQSFEDISRSVGMIWDAIKDGIAILLPPLLSGLGSALKTIGGVLVMIAPIVAGTIRILAAQLAPQLYAMAGAFKLIVSTLYPFALIIGGLIEPLNQLVKVFTLAFTAGLTEAMSILVLLGNLIDYVFGSNIRKFVFGINDALAAVIDKFAGTIAVVGRFIGGIITLIRKPVESTNVVVGAVNVAADALSGLLGKAYGALVRIITEATGLINPFLKIFLEASLTIFGKTVQAGVALVQIFVDGLGGAIVATLNFLTFGKLTLQQLDDTLQVVLMVIDNITTYWDTLITIAPIKVVLEAVTGLWTRFTNIFINQWKLATASFNDDKIFTFFEAKLKRLTNISGTVIRQILTVFRGFTGSLISSIAPDKIFAALNFDDVKTKVASAFGVGKFDTGVRLASVGGSVDTAAINANFQNAVDSIKTSWSGAINYVSSSWMATTQTLSASFSNTVTSIQAGWQRTTATLSAIWQSFIDLSKAAWQGAIAFYLGFWSGYTSTLTTGWQFVINGFISAWQLYINTLVQGWTQLGGLLTALWQSYVSTITAVWQNTVNVLTNAWFGFVNSIPATLQQISSWFGTLGQNASNSFTNGFRTFTTFVDTIKQQFMQLLDPITQVVDKVQELGGGAGGAITGLFGGGRASGGAVQAGTTYLVGEKGAELFTPTQNGYIVPNSAIAGARAEGGSVQAGQTYLVGEIGAEMFVPQGTTNTIQRTTNALKIDVAPLVTGMGFINAAVNSLIRIAMRMESRLQNVGTPQQPIAVSGVGGGVGIPAPVSAPTARTADPATAIQRAIALAIPELKRSEGFRSRAYDDGTGVATIGYGETRRDVVARGSITESEAARLLGTRFTQDYLKPALALIPEQVRSRLTAGQIAAIGSFSYNAGVDGFRRSAFGSALIAGQVAKAGEVLPTTFINRGTNVEAGLRARRLREQALFNTPDAPAALPSVGNLGLRPGAEIGAIANQGLSSTAQRIVAEARSWVGKNFAPGVSAQCANFVRELFKRTGVQIGETRKALDGEEYGRAQAGSFFGADVGQLIRDKSQLKPGDLVAWNKTYGNFGNDITHVGVYVGNGQIIDRSTSGAPIRMRSIDTFPGFVGGLRPTAYGQGAPPSATPTQPLLPTDAQYGSANTAIATTVDNSIILKALSDRIAALTAVNQPRQELAQNRSQGAALADKQAIERAQARVAKERADFESLKARQAAAITALETRRTPPTAIQRERLNLEQVNQIRVAQSQLDNSNRALEQLQQRVEFRDNARDIRADTGTRDSATLRVLTELKAQLEAGVITQDQFVEKLQAAGISTKSLGLTPDAKAVAEVPQAIQDLTKLLTFHGIKLAPEALDALGESFQKATEEQNYRVSKLSQETLDSLDKVGLLRRGAVTGLDYLNKPDGSAVDKVLNTVDKAIANKWTNAAEAGTDTKPAIDKVVATAQSAINTVAAVKLAGVNKVVPTGGLPSNPFRFTLPTASSGVVPLPTPNNATLDTPNPTRPASGSNVGQVGQRTPIKFEFATKGGGEYVSTQQIKELESRMNDPKTQDAIVMAVLDTLRGSESARMYVGLG